MCVRDRAHACVREFVREFVCACVTRNIVNIYIKIVFILEVNGERQSYSNRDEVVLGKR